MIPRPVREAFIDTMLLVLALFFLTWSGWRALWILLVVAACGVVARALVGAMDGWNWTVKYGIAFSFGVAFTSTTGWLESRFGLPSVVASVLWLVICALPLLLGYDRSEKSKAVRWLVCTMALGLLVGVFSGDSGSSGSMLSWWQTMFGLTVEQAELVTLLFRKTAHFVFYGLLAYTMSRASLAAELSIRSAICLALGWAIAHSVFDEVTQMSFDSRSGSFLDVLIDMSGACAALLIVWLRWRSRQRRA